MAVVPMQKIQIYGMKEDLKAILTLLQEEGVVQVEEITPLEKETNILQSIQKEDHDADYWTANIDFAIKWLNPYTPKRPIWAGKPVLTNEMAAGTVKSVPYKKIAQECQAIEEAHVTAQNELNQLDNEITLLSPWKHLTIPLDTPRTTETIQILFGTLPSGEQEGFIEALHNLSPLTTIEKIHSTASTAYLVVGIAKTHLHEAKTILAKHKFSEVALPLHPMTIVERLKKIEKRRKELKQALEECIENSKKLAHHVENLQIVHDVLIWQKEEQLVREKLKGTHCSFVLKGWIPQETITPLKQKLQILAPNNVLETLKIEEGEQPPVLLRNRKIVWPFESVTKLYGLPLPHEVDPTPFLATFFIVFFALCLTDAGYGLLLFLIMFTALKFFNLPEQSRGLVKLLMWGGLLTMVAGAFFGGYFGMTLEQAPNFLVSEDGESFKGQLINASAGTGPLTFLILALILGVVQVIFGKIVDGLWKLKQRQFLDALLDSFLWVFFLLAIIAFGLAASGTLIPGKYTDLLRWLVLGGVGAMILTQGRKQKTWLKKIGIGVLSLYGLVAYLGDILSYSRIMALGLGTGIIAFAMNTIAGLAYEMIPYVGFVFALLVLILGHTMNLVLSALGAFIHSARLQFVEFFGKFMEGGGTAFKPFQRSCKYIIIH